jgi:hypothetical protein
MLSVVERARSNCLCLLLWRLLYEETHLRASHPSRTTTFALGAGLGSEAAAGMAPKKQVQNTAKGQKTGLNDKVSPVARAPETVPGRWGGRRKPLIGLARGWAGQQGNQDHGFVATRTERRRQGSRRSEWRRLPIQQGANALPSGFGGGAQEAEVADALQALRQHMLQEAVQELFGFSACVLRLWRPYR